MQITLFGDLPRGIEKWSGIFFKRKNSGKVFASLYIGGGLGAIMVVSMTMKLKILSVEFILLSPPTKIPVFLPYQLALPL
ncbi:MAG: hypothetical protein HQ517_09030 [SAR324 cluster bacterium]|nr:hypothetical protein [SAR324 cluster bacterium]